MSYTLYSMSVFPQTFFEAEITGTSKYLFCNTSVKHQIPVKFLFSMKSINFLLKCCCFRHLQINFSLRRTIWNERNCGKRYLFIKAKVFHQFICSLLNVICLFSKISWETNNKSRNINLLTLVAQDCYPSNQVTLQANFKVE